MKIIKSLVFTLGLCSLAIHSGRARDIVERVSLAVTTISQNTNATSNATTTNVPPPIVSTHTTADFLTRLAVDEQLLSNWPSNSFPSGTVLAIVPNNGNPYFAAVLGTNVLLNLSDVISLSTDSIQVVSGAQKLQTGLASPATKTTQVVRISFDDRDMGNPDGPLHFSLRGIFTETTIDSAPQNGSFTEVHLGKMIGAVGDGQFNNVPFVCTGNVSSKGKAVFPAVF